MMKTTDQREDLIDAIAETMSNTCDMDVSFTQYATAVVGMLEKRGTLHPKDETAAVECLVDAALNDNAMANMLKKMRELQDDLYGYIEYQLKDDLAGNLVSLVHQMTDGVIEQLLAGNEEQMHRYLHCDLAGYTGRENMERFIVMHGALYEHSPITLRRKIVETFPDLIKNERIIDLEAQVVALVSEVNRLEQDRERLRLYYQGRE